MHYILSPYDSPWLAHWELSFICSGLCVACCCVCIFGMSHPVIITGCFFNHTSSFIQLVDSAEFSIVAFFSALHCVTSHAMPIWTACGTYTHQADVSSMRHISLDHSELPEWSWSLETPCQIYLTHGGVSRYAGTSSVVPALPFPRSNRGPGNQIVLHSSRTILAPHL